MSPDRSNYETLRKKASENRLNKQYGIPEPSQNQDERVQSIVNKWEKRSDLPKISEEGVLSE